MAKIVRFNGNLVAPASAALGTERTLFGSVTQADDLTSQFTADLLRGWGIVGPSDQPTLQDFNAMGYTLGHLHAYLHQMGVAEYNATQEYYIGSLTNIAGVFYVSLVNSNIGNAPASSPSQWEPFGQHGMVVLSSAGVTSWPVPLAMQLGIIKPRVTVVGAGGGGGGATSSANHNAAGGGGGAGGAAVEILDLTGVTSVSATVGAGGAGGASGGASGASGGSSSFGAYCSATGGSAGNSVTAGASVAGVGSGGGGGLGAGGTINTRGSGGVPGVISQATTAGSTAAGGFGGASMISGGIGGAAILGSGGSGAATTTGSQSVAGSTGANGVIIIEW